MSNNRLTCCIAEYCRHKASETGFCLCGSEIKINATKLSNATMEICTCNVPEKAGCGAEGYPCFHDPEWLDSQQVKNGKPFQCRIQYNIKDTSSNANNTKVYGWIFIYTFGPILCLLKIFLISYYKRNGKCPCQKKDDVQRHSHPCGSKGCSWLFHRRRW